MGHGGAVIGAGGVLRLLGIVFSGAMIRQGRICHLLFVIGHLSFLDFKGSRREASPRVIGNLSQDSRDGAHLFQGHRRTLDI